MPATIKRHAAAQDHCVRPSSASCSHWTTLVRARFASPVIGIAGAAIFSEEIYDVISQPQCEGGTLAMGFTYSGRIRLQPRPSERQDSLTSVRQGRCCE